MCDVGLHRGMDWPTYASVEAVSWSVLQEMRRSPAHCRERRLRPPAPTAPMLLGQAIHAAVLEPERFAIDFIEAPNVDRRTKRGRDTWDELNREHPEATILKAADYEHCKAIQRAAWAHPTVREVLGGRGLNEVSAVWTDGNTGLTCKGRLDRLTEHDGWSVVVDLKSTRDAGSRSFSRDIANLLYHGQLAFYLDGLAAIDAAEGREARQRLVYVIAQEKEPPYAAAVYHIDRLALDEGRDRYQRYLARYAECLERDEWPGYAAGVQTLTLPPWAFTEGAYEAVA